MELGWEPINNFICRQVSFFNRLLQLPNDQLCKAIYIQLQSDGDHLWKYHEGILNILSSMGLDHSIDGGFDIKVFNKFHGIFSRPKEILKISEKQALN